MVKTRLVLNFPGFEQTDPEKQLERIRHSAQKTGEIWNFTCERVHLSQAEEDNHAICEWRTVGKAWQTHTRMVQFSWNDIIRDYESQPHPAGFMRNFPKFLAFFFDGTVRRYWQASKRYWAFTIFPLILIAIFICVSWLAAGWLREFAGLAGIAGYIFQVALTAVVTLILCKWPGDRLYLLLTINDWGFARDMVNRSNARIEERYKEFASTVGKEIQAADYDEIVVCGHSFGSVWAVAALALALEDDPKLFEGKQVTFLALGSSLLKIALAPDAQFMRDWTARLFAEPQLFWHEIQTKDDLIAFYRANPVEMLRIRNHAAKLHIDRVRYSQAMEKRRYRSMRTSFYRTHRQYILYQDKPVAFDYMIRLFGPVESRQLASEPHSFKRVDPSVELV